MMTWPEIESLAATLGIPHGTARKWRQRRIPDRWRISLISAAWQVRRRRIDVDDLPRGPDDRRRR